MNKLTQQQKLDQSLSLTPAQIQAIKMLELTGLELEGRIERELEENPALEENYEEPQRESEDSTPEGDRTGSSANMPPRMISPTTSSESYRSASRSGRKYPSLLGRLRWTNTSWTSLLW